jgi:hypothetical protein
MLPNQVVKNLNQRVKYTGTKEELKGRTFIFLGATIRKKANDGDAGNTFYQAELLDNQRGSCVVIVNLKEIEEIS